MEISLESLVDARGNSFRGIIRTDKALTGTLQPGQAQPAAARIESLSVPNCSTDALIATLLVRSFHEDGSEGSCRKTLQFRCKSKDTTHAYIYTFADVDESVQYASAIPPLGRNCPTEGCAIVLATHGAGVDSGSRPWTDAYDAQPGAWVILPTNRGRYGYDWQGMGRRNALRAMEYFRTHLPGVAAVDAARLRPDPSRILFSGHSMGGHGCMVFSSNYAEQTIGAACAAGWIRFDHYITQFQGVGTSYMDPTLQSIMASAVAEYHTDVSAVNMKGIPFLARSGADDDAVAPWNPRRFARVLDEINGQPGFAQISEVPGKGHWWGGIMKGEVMNGFFNKTLSGKVPRVPESFRVRALGLWGSGRGGVRIVQFHAPSTSGWIDVDTTGPGCTWTMTTVNVRRFAVRRSRAAARCLEQVRVDGQPLPFTETGSAHLCQLGDTDAWRWCADGDAWRDTERSELNAGPARQVFAGPMVIVVGRGLDRHALTLANGAFWRGMAATEIVTDTEAQRDPGLIEGKNVILLGGPHVNRFAPTFINRTTLRARGAVQFSDLSGALSLGGRAYAGASTGCVLFGAYRPFSGGELRGSLFVLLSGTDASGIEQAVKAFPVGPAMEIPDFVVTGPSFAWQSSGGILAAGYWGNHWEYRADISYPRGRHT